MSIVHEPRDPPDYTFDRDSFMLRIHSGLGFEYSRSTGLSCLRDANVSDAEVALFRDSSAYGAQAWLDGYVPLHASAVMWDGRVHAFTGPSGAGKSTLVAALAQRGFAVFADDVLVLDLSDAQTIMARPGHKSIKLWADALTLTGLTATRRVRENLDKYYLDHPPSAAEAPLPLASLTFLESDAAGQPMFSAVRGRAGFRALMMAYYRPHYGLAVRSPQDFFEINARLCSDLALTKLTRAYDKRCFANGVDATAAYLCAMRGTVDD